MQKRLELILKVLRSARPIAEKNPMHGRVVERIDKAIRPAENLLKAARGGDQPKHKSGTVCLHDWFGQTRHESVAGGAGPCLIEEPSSGNNPVSPSTPLWCRAVPMR